MRRQGLQTLSITLILLHISVMLYGQDSIKTYSLNDVVYILSLQSPAAKVERLNFQNKLLLFENFKKSYLPTISFSLSPINFNRSLRLLQHPTDGSYSYVEDYSSNSSVGLSIRQKIGVTGGELNLSSNINYLNELSSHRNSFSTTPFSISYSQQLWGGRKLNRLEKKIEYAKNQIAIKEYCSKLSQIQQHALELYMTALLGKMERDIALKTMQNSDTLMHLANIKFSNGQITEYDKKQIELRLVNAQYDFDKACKNYSEAQERLGIFLGTGGVEVGIPEFDIPFAIEEDIVMCYVKQNNPLIARQKIEVLESEQNLYSIKVSNRFNGNISLSYGINKYAENLKDAYHNVNARQSVAVGFQIPIFQWGTNKNRMQIATNEYEANKIERERQLYEFENSVRETVNDYNHSMKLWITAKKAYELSQEQYDMMMKKFILGKVSLYEITSAQSERHNAMQRFYSAIKGSFNNYLKLRNMALFDFKKNIALEKVFISKQFY